MDISLKFICFLGGILLMAIWYLKVKPNFSQVLSDPAKRLQTLAFAGPGLILIALGGYLSLQDKPSFTLVYLSNGSAQTAIVQANEETLSLAAGTWACVPVKGFDERHAFRVQLGDRVVIDTVIGFGSFIGNLTDAQVVMCRQVIYGSDGGDEGNPPQWVLSKPGLQQFDTEPVLNLYDFDQQPANFMAAPQSNKTVMKYDLERLSRAAWEVQYGDE